VVRHAGLPVRSALEVGAGTGKATRLFASRGIEVTALEPNAAMARVLATTTRGMPVQPVITTLERLETAGRFDLVYAAAAWHWTDPATRWTRAVELLVPAGVLALFGRPAEPADPDLLAAIDEIEKQVLSDDPAVGHPWSIDEMACVDGLIESVQVGPTLPRDDDSCGFRGTTGYRLGLSHAGSRSTRRRLAPDTCGASRPVRRRRYGATVPGSTGLTPAQATGHQAKGQPHQRRPVGRSSS